MKSQEESASEKQIPRAEKFTVLLGQGHRDDKVRHQDTESEIGVTFRHRATTCCFSRYPQDTSKVYVSLSTREGRVSDTTACLSVVGNYSVATSTYQSLTTCQHGSRKGESGLLVSELLCQTACLASCSREAENSP